MVSPTSQAAVPVAELDRIARLHRSGRGLEDISLVLQPGEVLAVLGSPASGRSTLLEILATRIEPGAGMLRLWGADTPRARRAQRRRIGFQPRQDAHFPALSGFHNAYFFGSLFGLPRERLLPRLDGLLDQLELRGLRDHPVSAWDDDARRRLGVVEALLHGPELALLDDPLAGLGYASEVSVRHTLARASTHGTTVVFTTGDASLAASLGTRIAMLHRGRLVGLGTREELMSDIEGLTRVRCELHAAMPPETFRALPGVVAADSEGHHITLLVQRGGESLDDIMAEVTRLGGGLTEFTVREPDLGDVLFKRAGTRH